MGNPSFEGHAGGWRKLKWLVIPFDRPVQVAPCSIVDTARNSIRAIRLSSFRGATKSRAVHPTNTIGNMDSGPALRGASRNDDFPDSRFHQSGAQAACDGILVSVRQRQVGFRAHLDQPRRGPLELVCLIAV